MDSFPVWSNLKTFPCEQFRGLVDILIASYPCQPFSSAGQRKGAEDERHLWPFVRRAVEIIRPRAVFFENVEGHVSLGLREVLTELAVLGYRVENSRGEPTWGIFSAAEMGAPHNRKRVFIYAEDAEFSDERDWAGIAVSEQNNRDNAEFRQQRIHTQRGEAAGGDESRHVGGMRESSGASPQSGDDASADALEESTGVRSGTSRPDNIEGRQSGEFGESGMANCASDRRAERDTDTSGARQGKGTAKERNGLADRSLGVGLADTDSKRSIQNRQPSEFRSEGIEQSSGNSRGNDKKEGQEVRGDGLAVASGTGQQRGEFSGALREWFAHGSIGESRSPQYWPEFPARPDEEQHKWEPPRIIGVKRGLGGGVNGRSANVDRLRLLGNGVYPVTAAKALVTLYKRMRNL